MPRASTLRLRGGVSAGIHETIRKRDFNRAVHIAAVRDRMAGRSAYWDRFRED